MDLPTLERPAIATSGIFRDPDGKESSSSVPTLAMHVTGYLRIDRCTLGGGRSCSIRLFCLVLADVFFSFFVHCCFLLLSNLWLFFCFMGCLLDDLLFSSISKDSLFIDLDCGMAKGGGGTLDGMRRILGKSSTSSLRVKNLLLLLLLPLLFLRNRFNRLLVGFRLGIPIPILSMYESIEGLTGISLNLDRLDGGC